MFGKKNPQRTARPVFTPSVSSLEERNLMSVSGLVSKATAARANSAIVGSISAASNSHKKPQVTPLTTLVGTWANQTWLTADFARQFPNAPTYVEATDVTRLVGNTIVSEESDGGLVTGWSIRHQGKRLVLTVQPANMGTPVELVGRRAGTGTWIFQGDVDLGGPTPTRIMSVFTFANRDAYSFSNFEIVNGKAQLLYVTMNQRMVK